MNKANFIQAQRILRVESPLGADQLLAQKLTFRESISELFEGRLSVRSKNINLTPQDLLGKSIDVSLELGEGERRTWNAIVTDMIAGPQQAHDMRHYELILRPDAWLMSQNSDCRIWKDKTAIDIANELLGEHGLPAPITGGVLPPPEPHHYSVQWNESDLDYLTRRLEADGLFFWWSHEAGQHVMHIASHQAGYQGGADVRFAHGSTDLNHINRFETRFRYVPGKHTARDWNFQTPNTVPESNTTTVVNLPKNQAFDRYEYPIQGGYGPGERASEQINSEQVARLTKLRMLADEAEHNRVEGASNTRTLAAGSKFTPYDVANPDNRFAEHVVVAIEHEAVDASYETGGNQPDYANRFIAIPADVPATPRRTTPLPRIDGTQVALVAGPEGEEIHPDEYGRIKLWFPWDRRAVKDGSDTCWVRVMQNWAGSGWGGQVIPRIGMEVMVTYLDGDPDRPVITGVVPNERQKVPYELPKHKTRAVWRSDSHKSEGFNEISFEDEAGNEDMFLHAQKDMTQKVLNNQSANIGANRVETIGNNASLQVGDNLVEKVGRNKNVTVGGGPLQMLSMLMPLMQAGGKLFKKAGQKSGTAPVQEMAQEFLGNTHVDRELSMFSAMGGFVASDGHRKGQGVAQAGKAASLASTVGGLIGGSGILNSFVERFRTDTVGIARTEQIGISKNTVVGNIQTSAIGKTKKLVVGDTYDYEVKKKIFGRTRTHILQAKDKFIIGGPGGTIIIDNSGVTIKTKHLKVKSPKVDFTSGAPDQVEALAADQPFVQECKNEGK